MKVWNVAQSKFYPQIMTALCVFLSLNEDDTTEAEAHQAFTGLGTLAEIKTKAMDEARAAVKAEVDALTAKLTDLETKVTQLTEAGTTSATALQSLTDRVDTLTTEAAEKDKTITSQATQITVLSGEVSRYKAGKTVDPKGTDENLDVRNGDGTVVGKVIKGTALAEELGINKPATQRAN